MGRECMYQYFSGLFPVVGQCSLRCPGQIGAANEQRPLILLGCHLDSFYSQHFRIVPGCFFVYPRWLRLPSWLCPNHTAPKSQAVNGSVVPISAAYKALIKRSCQPSALLNLYNFLTLEIEEFSLDDFPHCTLWIIITHSTGRTCWNQSAVSAWKTCRAGKSWGIPGLFFL